MARTYQVAGVYRIMNKATGKVYIGESLNLTDRMSVHRNAKSMLRRMKMEDIPPIDQAIINEGVDAFQWDILESSITDIRLSNIEYRRNREAYYIEQYDSTDPEKGYNLHKRNHSTKLRKRKGVKTKMSTKLYKSNPILAYDLDDNTTMMYFGKKSFAELHNIDRGIIARATKHGKRWNHFLFYPAVPELFATTVYNVVFDKSTSDAINGAVAPALERYLKGLKSVAKFSEKWGLGLPDYQPIVDEALADADRYDG